MPVSQQIINEQIKAVGKFDSFGTKKEIKELPNILRDHETILFLTSGFYDGNTWLIVATDMRVIFLDKGMLFGLKQNEIPYDKISAISHKVGLLLASITISSSAGNFLVDNIQKTDAPKFVEIVSNHIHNLKNTSSQPAHQSNDDDIVSKLERLAALKEKGILTEEEFANQKAKLLG